MTQQGDNQHHHVPTGRIKRIQPRQHTGLFSAHDLRSDLSKLTRKISPRRQLAAVIPLVVALIGWFVVPSFAATYQFTGSGRQYGISESTNGGLGAFEIWDGTGWQTAGSTSYKLLGNFLLHGSDGTSVPAYCISLEDQHYVNDVLTPGAEGPSRQVEYIVNNYFPVVNHPGALSNDYEASAVQLAIWGFTNDSLDPAPYAARGWLPVPGVPAVIVARAQQIMADANANADAWWAQQHEVHVTIHFQPTTQVDNNPAGVQAYVHVAYGSGAPAAHKVVGLTIQ
ncbi:MAG: thioester domain-containing protein, partial [Candidatus Dormibacteria bacterium]